MKTKKLTRNEIDTVKGILIICIVTGHTLLSNTLLPSLKTVLYAFHVYCFLFLPFIFVSKPFNFDTIKNTFIRYAVPYVIFVTLCSIVYNFGIQHNISFISWLENLSRGIITGNDLYLEMACGFGLYWFLPVLIVLNILRNFYYAQRSSLKTLLIILFCIGHILFGAMLWKHKQYFPFFGFHIAVYIMPLGILCGFIYHNLFSFLIKFRLLVLLLFILSIYLMIENHSEVCLSHMGVYSYRSPALFLLHNLIPILALFSFLTFSNIITKVPFVSFIGKNSLIIYLSHQIFIYGIETSLSTFDILKSNIIFLLATGLFSLFCGVCFPLGIMYILNSRQNLRRLILPRNANEFFHAF